MNAYIIVEGDRTETTVYPAWLSIIAPDLQRINDPWQVKENCYYLFSGGGIPNIYHHTVQSVIDINNINSGDYKFDCLMVCLDTEQESREYILEQIDSYLKASNVKPQGFQIVVFEQKVCMETWFLGNRKIFKSNPQDTDLLRYINYYNVGDNDPELMGNIDKNKFSTMAGFHFKYLKSMLAERNIRYSKNNTEAICQQDYLKELIKRYKETNHLKSFGSWYEFVRDNL